MAAEEEGANEESLPVKIPIVPAGGNLTAAAPAGVSLEQAERMKVVELREELQKRGLSKAGKKETLLARLKEGIEKQVPILEGGNKISQNTAGDSFTFGAYWKLLEQDGDFVQEEIGEHHAPTVPPDEVQFVKKRNYKEKFDRPPFTGTTKVPARYRNGKISQDHQGNTKYKVQVCNETVPNIEWCHSKGLGLQSHPVEWFESFVPLRNG